MARGWKPRPASAISISASGVAVNALGHAHPHLVAALKDQAEKLWHTSNLYRVAGQEKLGRPSRGRNVRRQGLLLQFRRGSLRGCHQGRAPLPCGGRQPERNRIITCHGAFHGRTLATLAAAGNPKYLEGFGPEMPGFDHVPFNDLEAVRGRRRAGDRGHHGRARPGRGRRPCRIGRISCAGLRALCDEAGILLILDEVQTGVGRSGTLLRARMGRRHAGPHGRCEGHRRRLSARRRARDRTGRAAV